MDNVRIRLKLQGDEFEAEGPDPLVRAHLAEFKNLLKPAPAAPAGTGPVSNPQDLVYLADPGLGTLTLRILPSTNQGPVRQAANTLLLVLNGFHASLGTKKVPVLTATNAIRQSGLVGINRLSNAFRHLEKDGLAMKSGRGKGTAYHLTAKGHSAAQELIQKTLSRAQIQA